MSKDEQERERVRKRRDELGDAELMRRFKLADKAQDICAALIFHPNVEETRSMLTLAEELCERLKVWTWGQ